MQSYSLSVWKQWDHLTADYLNSTWTFIWLHLWSWGASALHLSIKHISESTPSLKTSTLFTASKIIQINNVLIMLYFVFYVN